MPMIAIWRSLPSSVRSTSVICTMLPQDEPIDILGQFLRCYAGEYASNIPVASIQQLTHLVLKENALVFNNKFYRQVIGGAMGSPFILILGNIFMCYWKQRWIRRQDQAMRSMAGKLTHNLLIFCGSLPKASVYRWCFSYFERANAIQISNC